MVQNLVWQTSTVADISLLSNRFTDVARSVTVVRAKKADLQITNGGWPYFMRVIRAVPLFGEGFGELLKPTASTKQPCCASTAPVPTGKDFLAAYGGDLDRIMSRAGGLLTERPWRLAGSIYWCSPGGEAFEPCTCASRQAQPDVPRRRRKERGISGTLTRALGIIGQGRREACDSVSFANRLQRLTKQHGAGMQSPRELVKKGAVIFGCTPGFSLSWNPEGGGSPDTDGSGSPSCSSDAAAATGLAAEPGTDAPARAQPAGTAPGSPVLHRSRASSPAAMGSDAVPPAATASTQSHLNPAWEDRAGDRREWRFSFDRDSEDSR